MWVQYVVAVMIFLLGNPTYAATRPSRAAVTNTRKPVVGKTVTRNVRTRKTVAARATGKSAFVTNMSERVDFLNACKAQYMQCMDNYCNVLDDNQGRCSCSANLKNYAATEAALAKATEELQDVAQKMAYIGLTSDQVESLFTQTEAELKMSGTSDNTQLKNDLDRIKNMIVDVKSGSASSTSNTGISFDLSGLLDFTIDSTGFDLSSLFGGSSNTNSVSNQRGEQLYKTASARCKASVLNSCANQGVDISLITNAYDLEIDKQCILYERSLTETNTQMSTTVRNAKSLLQNARLMVAQKKNAYNMRECISELDKCMQEDFVCGSDYENCLDPTGKWIVNGEIVTGSTPGVPGGKYEKVDGANAQAESGTLYDVWNYSNGSDSKNVWSNGSINDYISTMVKNEAATLSTGQYDMATYLRTKIGYTDKDGKNYGMCQYVLNQCQDLTYEGKGTSKTFKHDNDVIKNYLVRTMSQIKAKQDDILSKYADSCISDVSRCLSSNSYNYNGYTNTNSYNTSDAAINACMSVINTCKSATTPNNDALSVKTWLNQALNSGYPITQDVCESYTGAQWKNNVCQIMSGNLTFKFSTNSSAWVAKTDQKSYCDYVPNATFDSVSNLCITTSTPTATKVQGANSTVYEITSGQIIDNVDTKEVCDTIGNTVFNENECKLVKKVS